MPVRTVTCRYFALGPRCPNGAECNFAHRDTGRLAYITHQPGSCLRYCKTGSCHLGTRCPYEHRNTGVTGLGQGTVELTGFELQVANAAFKAGFNTTNHVGLFDLIWVVRREALKAKLPPQHPQRQPSQRRPPPPPHPIYPDRYRPSGIGDNTNKKRKRNQDIVLKFDPVPGLMQRGATKDDPISLDEDEEKENVPPQPFVQGVGLVNKKVKSNQGRGIAVHRSRPVIDEIIKVKNKLERVRLEVNGCQSTMRNLFDQNREAFDDAEVMTLLRELATAMNKAYDGAAKGGKTADKTAAAMTFGGPVF